MNFKAAVLLPLSLLFSPVYAAECGRVTIADMNWNSASLIANIDKFILEHGYGCDAELIPGDTIPTSTSMSEKGEPDIAPEMWENAIKDLLKKGVAEKRLRYAGKSLVDGGEEGFWVPKYLVDKYPELTTIEGVKKHAKLFKHLEDPDKSAFYGCPAGWQCQVSAGNLYKALKLNNEKFDLIDPGSAAGLSGAIAKANERKEPWFGYYWAPTAVLGKYEMVKVDLGADVDMEHFLNCTTNADCDEPKVTSFPPAPVYTVTTESFANKAPAALDYLQARGFTNQQMNTLLAWMEDHQADGEETMYHFLEDYPQIWTQWLPESVAHKIKKAL